MTNIIILVVIAIYFSPTILAAVRKKEKMGLIFLLNLLLGWTVVGWLIAGIWASSKDKK